MPRFPIDLGLPLGERTGEAREVRRPDAAGAAEFEAICRAHGARMIGGITAVLAIVDRELAGVDDYFTITALADRALADVTAAGPRAGSADLHPSPSACRHRAHLHRPGRHGSPPERGAACSEVPVPTVIGALLAAGTAP